MDIRWCLHVHIKTIAIRILPILNKITLHAYICCTHRYVYRHIGMQVCMLICVYMCAYMPTYVYMHLGVCYVPDVPHPIEICLLEC
jgi:hypothetical protein